MKELLLSVMNIVGAVGVYLGMLIIVPKICEYKFTNKK
jgi:hypothetical protein